MPVYNEEKTIETILERVEAVDLPKEIVLVDDASADSTRAILERLADRPNLKIHFHERNRGKGAALRTALKHFSGTHVLIQDADLEYDPDAHRFAWRWAAFSSAMSFC